MIELQSNMVELQTTYVGTYICTITEMIQLEQLLVGIDIPKERKQDSENS